MSDYVEAIYSTDPKKKDTDGDGLSDADEIARFYTNPLVADTDQDGIPDGSDPFPMLNIKKGTHSTAC
jgi:hypothetical protein